jgi:drug/metabolite transporter (DMT)-like permease
VSGRPAAALRQAKECRTCKLLLVAERCGWSCGHSRAPCISCISWFKKFKIQKSDRTRYKSAVLAKKSNAAIAMSLVVAVFLWGGTNTGTKFTVGIWPPIWTGATRFLCAGFLLLAILHWTKWLGAQSRLTLELKRRLWWRGGLSLAVYIILFNFALHYTSTSHVALYLGASPVWALFWEGRPARSWVTLQRYSAAFLALAGVFVLFWPTLKNAGSHWIGEVCGMAASVLWTNYGRQCRALSTSLSGAEISAHTMWRAGALLLPLSLIELARGGLVFRADLIAIHIFCILAGGVASFVIWNNALQRWPTSQVLLFNNLIPLSTMTWAHLCLAEPVTSTFWFAMILIVAGVVLGQTNWKKIFPAAAVAPE